MLHHVISLPGTTRLGVSNANFGRVDFDLSLTNRTIFVKCAPDGLRVDFSSGKHPARSRVNQGKLCGSKTPRADIHVTTAALRGISVYCPLENPLSFRNTAPPSQWLSRQKPDTFSVICVDCTNFPFLFSFSNFFPSSLCRRASQGLLSGALITGVPNRVT